METAIALGACAVAGPFLYQTVKARYKTTVNCWFCNENSKVLYRLRNNFVCHKCEQYNGFKEDGDYNRVIAAQRNVVNSGKKNFCVRPTPKKASQNSVPGYLRKLNIGAEDIGENGLCTECNRNQEKIMVQVANFEPKNEANWNDELEEYRYKLERLYQLCSRCTLVVHGKIEQDKAKYAYLIELRDRISRALRSTVGGIFDKAKTQPRRKQFFSGGWRCESLHWLAFVVAGFLFFAHFDRLQQDVFMDVLQLPFFVQTMLPLINECSVWLLVLLFTVHMTSATVNRCRVTLPDILLPIAVGLHLLSFSSWFEENYQDDVVLCRCAFSSFCSVLTTAIVFLPRKRKHRKRPNYILSSAFSIASTPVSQCSSQLDSRNASLRDSFDLEAEREKSADEARRAKFDEMVSKARTTMSDISNASPRMKWRENNLFSPNTTVEENKENSDAMDWDDDESIATLTRNTQRRLQAKEATPSRELAPSIASMSLRRGFAGTGGGLSFGTPTPSTVQMRSNGMTSGTRPLFAAKAFSTVSAGPTGFSAQTPPSLFARSLSNNGKRQSGFMRHSPTNSVVSAVLTSVSQQSTNPATSNLFVFLSGFFFCTTICTIIALVHFIFKN